MQSLVVLKGKQNCNCCQKNTRQSIKDVKPSMSLKILTIHVFFDMQTFLVMEVVKKYKPCSTGFGDMSCNCAYHTHNV